MTKDAFILLLEARKSALDTARKIVEIGFDLESSLCKQIFSIMEGIERTIEKDMNIKPWDDSSPFGRGMNSLGWALEYLDDGRAANYSVIDKENTLDKSVERQIQNFSQLYDLLVEEQED